MRIQNEDGQIIHIDTNHDFLVPADIVGKRVVVEGNGFKTVTPVDELIHLAKMDKATLAEIAAITSPLEEFEMQAKGLVILK